MLMNFVAAMQDGVSTSSEVSERTAGAAKRVREMSGDVKLPGLAAVLGASAGLGGKASSDVSDEQSVERKLVREHTAASLFNILRNAMRETNSIKQVPDDSDLTDVRVAETVEIQGQIDVPPLDVLLRTFNELLPFMDGGDGDSDAIKVSRAQRRNLNAEQLAELEVAEREQEAARQEREAQKAGLKASKEIVSLLEDDAGRARLIDLVLRTERASVLIAASRENLNDEARAQLVRGSFRVVGKVTGVSHDRAARVPTQRGGVVGLIAEAALTPVVAEAQSSFAKQGIRLEMPPTEVVGPYLQIIPLAIFI